MKATLGGLFDLSSTSAAKQSLSYPMSAKWMPSRDQATTTTQLSNEGCDDYDSGYNRRDSDGDELSASTPYSTPEPGPSNPAMSAVRDDLRTSVGHKEHGCSLSPTLPPCGGQSASPQSPSHRGQTVRSSTDRTPLVELCLPRTMAPSAGPSALPHKRPIQLTTVHSCAPLPQDCTTSNPKKRSSSLESASPRPSQRLKQSATTSQAPRHISSGVETQVEQLQACPLPDSHRSLGFLCCFFDLYAIDKDRNTSRQPQSSVYASWLIGDSSQRGTHNLQENCLTVGNTIRWTIPLDDHVKSILHMLIRQAVHENLTLEEGCVCKQELDSRLNDAFYSPSETSDHFADWVPRFQNLTHCLENLKWYQTQYERLIKELSANVPNVTEELLHENVQGYNTVMHIIHNLDVIIRNLRQGVVLDLSIRIAEAAKESRRCWAKWAEWNRKMSKAVELGKQLKMTFDKLELSSSSS